MSARDELAEGSTSFAPVGHQLYSDGILSTEDQAWADSCFVGDSEILDSDWDFLANALQEDGASPYVHLPVSEIDYLVSPNVATTDDNASSDDGEEKEDGDSDMMVDGNIKSKPKKAKGINPFRPSYNEHLQESEDIDHGLDLDLFDFNADTLAEDIFKVWDLSIPAEEENELVTKQLNPESSIGKLPATSDGFEAWKGLKDGSLDDLIAGISDLSLELK